RGLLRGGGPRLFPPACRRRLGDGAPLRRRLRGAALPRVLAVSALALRRPPDPDRLSRADAVPAPPRGSRPLSPATDVAERVKKFENRVGDVLQRPDLPYRRNPFSRFLHTLAVGAWRIDRATPWVT